MQSATTTMQVQMLDVPESMLEQHGAVSEEVAIAMATGAAKIRGRLWTKYHWICWPRWRHAGSSRWFNFP